MSHFTYYNFSKAQGFAGNLACKPQFRESKQGEMSARVTLFCAVSGDKRSPKETPLVAYVHFDDEKIFSELKVLNKGDFIRINYEKLTIGMTTDDQSGKEQPVLFIDATDFAFMAKSNHQNKPKQASLQKAANSHEVKAA